MKIVRPIDIAAALVSTNVPETVAQWLVGTTYAADEVVRGTGDNAHRLYVSAAGSNTGHAVTDAAWWTFYAATNAYSMFDQSIGRQTTNADSIVVEFDVTGRIDTAAFQNVSAESIQIVVTDAIDGVVYDETFIMVSDSGITDWYAYFTEEIVRIADLTVTELPGAYANPTIEATLLDAGQTVACGEMILGAARHIGGTKWSPTGSIQDYSTKEADLFGGFNVVERAYAKRWSFQVLVAAGFVDTLYDMLASYRATPILYIGDDDYNAMAVFGYFRDFSIDVAYPAQALCSLEIEGLA